MCVDDAFKYSLATRSSATAFLFLDGSNVLFKNLRKLLLYDFFPCFSGRLFSCHQLQWAICYNKKVTEELAEVHHIENIQRG